MSKTFDVVIKVTRIDGGYVIAPEGPLGSKFCMNIEDLGSKLKAVFDEVDGIIAEEQARIRRSSIVKV